MMTVDSFTETGFQSNDLITQMAELEVNYKIVFLI